MTTRERVGARVLGWWPDVLVSFFLVFGSIIMLANRDGAERIAVTRATNGTIGDVFLASMTLGGFALAGLIIARRPVGASWCAAFLGILLTAYGFAIYIAYKGDAAGTLFVYYALATLMVNRSIVLARGIVIPRWRDPTVWTPRRRP